MPSRSWRPVLRQSAPGARRGWARRGQHPAAVAGATTAWHLRQGWLKWHKRSAHVQRHKQGVASMAARSNLLCRSRAFKALHAKTGPTVGSTRTLTVGIAPDAPYGRRLTWALGFHKSPLINSAMSRTFLRKRTAAFTTWWRAPTTKSDRVIGVMVGLFGGMSLGAIIGILTAPTTISFEALAYWCAGLSGLCAVLGWAFPKAISIAFFPLAVFGISPSA
jgi:hypothetical protein